MQTMVAQTRTRTRTRIRPSAIQDVFILNSICRIIALAIRLSMSIIMCVRVQHLLL